MLMKFIKKLIESIISFYHVIFLNTIFINSTKTLPAPEAIFTYKDETAADV